MSPSDDEHGWSGAWRAVLATAAVLVFALFLFEIREGLNPFVLLVALLAVLLPFRGLPGHSLVVVVVTLLTLFWMLDTTGFLLAPFVLAMVIAYVLDPAVDHLEGRGMGRSVAIALLALPVLGVIVPTILFGIPALGGQITDLLGRAPELLQQLSEWLQSLNERIAGMNLPPQAVDFVERVQNMDSEAVVGFLQERQAEIARRVWAGVLGIGRGIGSFLTVLGYVVLTPVLTFYLLRDWDHLTRSMADLIPRARRDRVMTFAREYDHLLSRYLRGQLLVALIVGSITALGLWALGFPYAFLLGVLVAVFGLVPYLGLVLSLIPAILIALVSGSVLASLLKVALVYGVAQALEGAVISPRIVGESVGLHPVWVVLALAIGGFYFGFVGLLIGVPLAVGAKLLIVRGLARYRESGLYREEEVAP